MVNSGTRRTLLIALAICGAIFLFCIAFSASLLAECLFFFFFIWLHSTQQRKLYVFFTVFVICGTFATWFFHDYIHAYQGMITSNTLLNSSLTGSHGVDWVLFSALYGYWCYVATASSKDAERLMTLSTVDPLTEILNRREFFHAALIELNRSQRYGFNMALIMIDIDNFKVINDTYGHVSGDRALRKLADIARHMLRVPDILARYGGEEFVVVMPQTSESEAILVAERLRVKIANELIETREGSFNMTVSIGMTKFYLGEEMLEDAIERADQALYHAKKTGKNRVCVSRQGGEPVTVTQENETEVKLDVKNGKITKDDSYSSSSL